MSVEGLSVVHPVGAGVGALFLHGTTALQPAHAEARAGAPVELARWSAPTLDSKARHIVLAASTDTAGCLTFARVDVTRDGRALYAGRVGASGPRGPGVHVPVASVTLGCVLAPATCVAVVRPRGGLGVAPARRCVVFLRHGRAAHNELMATGRRAAGRALPDPELTDMGKGQATTSGSVLARLLAHLGRPGFDVVMSSPFKRALQTTHLALGQLPVKHTVTVTHLPAEHCQGPECPCDTGSELADLVPWLHGSLSTAGTTVYDLSWVRKKRQLEDGTVGPMWPVRAHEDVSHMCHRARLLLAAIRALPPSADTVLVVTHGGFLRSMFGINVPNCGVLVEWML